MKFFLFIASLLWIPLLTQAQGGWLSTPESIREFREQVESMRPSTSRFDLKITDQTIPLNGRDLPIRIYRPPGMELRPTMIYVHGACWVAGSLDSHDEICRYLSLKGDINVIAIDYRLAPEYKYPSAHNDVYEGIEWIWKNAGNLQLDPQKLAISGESTGAYFAAATALRARDTAQGPKFNFQLLVYAALDGGGSSWTACKDLYFNEVAEVRSNYGSPLWAENLADLPPTFNIFGQYEISRAEEELFIQKLKAQGVFSKSFMHEGVGHDVGSWLSVKEETPAHLKALEFIKEGFNNK